MCTSLLQHSLLSKPSELPQNAATANSDDILWIDSPSNSTYFCNRQGTAIAFPSGPAGTGIPVVHACSMSLPRMDGQAACIQGVCIGLHTALRLSLTSSQPGFNMIYLMGLHEALILWKSNCAHVRSAKDTKHVNL